MSNNQHQYDDDLYYQSLHDTTYNNIEIPTFEDNNSHIVQINLKIPLNDENTNYNNITDVIYSNINTIYSNYEYKLNSKKNKDIKEQIQKKINRAKKLYRALKYKENVIDDYDRIRMSDCTISIKNPILENKNI